MRLQVLAMILIGGLLSQGCASMTFRVPVPQELVNQAKPVGVPVDIPGVRTWADAVPENLNEFLQVRHDQIRAERPELLARGARHTVSYLAISGGSANGAYGAGLLVGWTARGTRPEFEIVTGISTGALTAPFAFLGSAYDAQLKKVFTTISSSDVESLNVLAGLFGGTAFANNHPLAVLIAKYVDRKFLREIAREFNKGRRLYIGTTNLDAERPVMWDMGRIASLDNDMALKLFRRILLASAAIPGAFPPVQIKVKTNGDVRDEMHVDGGVTAQVFLFPGQVNATKVDRKLGIRPRRHVYIIRNGRLGPEWQSVKAKTMKIISRSLSTLIKNQGIGDLYRIYETAKINRIKYHLSSIPTDFKDTSTELFDRKYMNALFDLGFKIGKSGKAWVSRPPGLRAKASR